MASFPHSIFKRSKYQRTFKCKIPYGGMSSKVTEDLALARLAKSSLIVLASMFLAKCAGYLYKVAIARYATPAEFGTFSLALIIIGFAVSLSSLGLSEGLTRYIAYLRGKKKVSEIASLISSLKKKVVFLSILTGIGVFAGAPSFAQYFQSNALLADMLSLMALGIPLTVFAGFHLALLRAHEDIKKYSLISNTAQGIGKVVLLAAGLAVLEAKNALPVSFVLTAGLLALLSFVATKKIRTVYRETPLISLEKRVALQKTVLQYSLPLLYTGMVFSLLFWIDSLVIGHYLPPEQVGIYAIAITLISVLGIAPELFMQLFLPLMSKYFAENNLSQVRGILRRVNKWILIGNIPVALALFFFPGVFIHTLFGATYASAETCVKILAFGGLFSSLSNSLTAVLTAKGKSYLLACNVTCVATMNFFLNLALIGPYGIEGVAYATAVTWAVFLITLLVQVRKELKELPFKGKEIGKIICGAGALFVGLEIYRLTQYTSLSSLLVGVGIGGIGYLGILYLLKTHDAQDREVFRSIKQRIQERIAGNTS